MTNEPPPGEHEELVEDDLPGLSDSEAEAESLDDANPFEQLDESLREWDEALDERAAERALEDATAAEQRREEAAERFRRGEPEPETAGEVAPSSGGSFFDAALPDGLVIPDHPRRPGWVSSWSPLRILIAAFITASGIGVLVLGANSLAGGSDEPAPGVQPEIDVTASSGVATSGSTPALTPAATSAAGSAQSTPPAGLDYCINHPQQDDRFCEPHYLMVPGGMITLQGGDQRSPPTFELTLPFAGPIPTDPEFPIEYRLTLESSNGQQFEHVLSGGSGEPLTCTRTANGAPSALGPGDICGDLIEPNTIHMLIDMSALAPGKISWMFGSLETGADGLRRGDYHPGDSDFELTAP